MSERLFTSPVLDDISREWYAAAADRRLLVQRCVACLALQFYPRAHCTTCSSSEVEWLECTGRGRIHTFSIIRKSFTPEFRDECPYVLAIVELEEGPRVTTRIVEHSETSLRCDAPVRVDYRDLGWGTVLPVFRVEADPV